jgi:hypothetical protein
MVRRRTLPRIPLVILIQYPIIRMSSEHRKMTKPTAVITITIFRVSAATAR